MKRTKNRTLGVCVVNKTDLGYIVKSLSLYFDGQLDIVALPFDRLDEADIDPAAVISTYLTTERVSERFPEARNLPLKRELVGNALEEIVQLPKGTRMLVANAPQEIAVDTRDALAELALNQVEITAYWPGADIDVSGYGVVVYPGIRDYCPKGDFTYIDIGHRSIAIETIIEIIRFFGLPSSSTAKYYQMIMKQATDACHGLARSLTQANMIKESLEKICDLNNSAIFALSGAGEVIVFNQSAASFFKMYKSKVLGRSHAEVFREYPELIEILDSPEEMNESIISLNKQHVVVSKNNYYIDSLDNALITILPLASLQLSETKARMKLHSSGFIAKHTFADLLGTSAKINNIKKLSGAYAHTNNTILITGESGTGKEVFAQAIHNASQRAGQPFVGINFAALPETLAESELFGYAEGAFTGASRKGKEGLFELAHNGTMFFDEIGDASLAMQTKLLRVLEEKEIVRVGGDRVIPVDVRIICATNRDLEERMREGHFRADLYYRIKVLSLHLPPLRERKEDILVIVRGMLKNKCAKMLLEDFVVQGLLEYPWPGNARELRTIAEYMNMLSDMSYRGATDEEIFGMLRVFLDYNLTHPGAARDAPFAAERNAPAQSGEGPAAAEGGYLAKDLRLLLQAIKDYSDQGVMVGRGTLARMPSLVRAGLTESKIKVRLKALERMNLIAVGTTKQGAALTGAGARMLERNGKAV